MKKRLQISLIFICISTVVMSQSNYSDYTESNKRIISFDDFSNNQNRWWVNVLPDGTGVIQDGNYTLEWKGNPIWNTWNSFPIDFTKDYEIETRVKQIAGSLDNLYGLTFNRTDKGNCGFVINGNGGSIVYQDRDNEDRRFIKDGGEQVPDVKIAVNDYNKLTIRKIKDKFYFYINEKLLKEGNVVDFSSNTIGFQLWYQTKISVDYLKISYLEKRIVEPVIVDNVPSAISDVDSDIPTTAAVNDKTFAVVIGNEIYSKEIRVKFAMTDAKVFKQYLQKTLGLPENNIQYLENATYGQILDAIKWINDVIKVYNGEAKVIFYYAGHGMPDEQTKSAFLLPVDGNSQNPATAVRLADLYGKLS